MTVRSFLVLGLCVQALWAGIRFLAQISAEIEPRGLFEAWLWVGVVAYPATAFLMVVSRRELAGLILGRTADKPLPLDQRDLVVVVTAFVGLNLVMNGFDRLAEQCLTWSTKPLPEVAASRGGGLIGYWLREVFLTQFAGFMGVAGARLLPRIMRLTTASE